MLPIILIALSLLIIAGITHLIRAHIRFIDRFNEVEAQLLIVSSFVEGMILINDLAKLAWHRSHNDKVKQLYAYLRGRFNIVQRNIVI